MYTVYVVSCRGEEWKQAMIQMSTCIIYRTIEYELLIIRLKIFAFCDGVKLEHDVRVLFNIVTINKGCVHTP